MIVLPAARSRSDVHYHHVGFLAFEPLQIGFQATFSSYALPSRWKGSRTSVGAIGVYRGTRLYCAAEINRRLTAERAPRGYLSPASPCADRGRARHGGRPGVLGLIPCTGVASSITIDMSIR
jgi:hypothetical protein